MKIKDNSETKKRISIETMLYRLTETNMSISIVVLIHSSIVVLLCRNIAIFQQRSKKTGLQVID
jgi:hypothetical protein